MCAFVTALLFTTVFIIIWTDVVSCCYYYSYYSWCWTDGVRWSNDDCCYWILMLESHIWVVVHQYNTPTPMHQHERRNPF